ncbi:hypothetical protein BXZ70DRAFT_1063915 [Cristinia sonorae]|uniref:Uncharacterized protein n=1 Tax=Cristinia sonorae TaxID=1940300 RepID=A0A8K0USZ0_9AGAR|nr:hypothetical protein BXZ70DRAFT_1063915 [Cristinia sonorae]
MAVNFPIDKSYLVGGWLASGFWGAFTILYIICIATTLQRRKHWHFTTFAITVMYALATTHIGLILARLIQAFIVHVNDIGAVMYLADIGQHLNRSKDMIYVTSIILGDSILVWRCFMVWNSNWLVITVPSIMVLSTGISGYGAIGQYYLPDPYVPTTVKWATAMLAVSMATNILLTLLTAGRIWFLTSEIKFTGLSTRTKPQMRYRAVILIILEAGMLVTVGKILEFVFFIIAPDDGLDGDNALYVIMDCMPQIMGIAPTLILLAVNQGLTSPGSEAYSVGGPAKWRHDEHDDSTSAVAQHQTGTQMVFAAPILTHHTRTDTSASSYSGDAEVDILKKKPTEQQV